MLSWINRNKTWIFSGIGVAIVSYFIRTQILDDTGKNTNEVKQLGKGGNVSNINNSSNSRIVNNSNNSGNIHYAERDLNVNNYYGISAGKFQEIAKDLAVKDETLTTLLRILEERQTSREDLDSSLRKITDQYKKIERKIESFQSNDPAVIKIKNKATAALNGGDFQKAGKLIIENSDAKIECGEILLGSIGKVGESKNITFNAKSGEVVAISVTNQSTSAIFRPCWELLDPSANRIDSWEYDVNRTRVLPVDGLFTIKVWDHDNDGTGNFSIRLEPVSAYFNGKISCATPITCGEIKTATLETHNTIHSYRFNAKAGEIIAIAVRKSEESTSALFRPCWKLLDPLGNRIDSWEYDVNRTRVLSVDGIFTIRVWDHDQDGIGEYSIRLEPVSAYFNGAPSCARPIKFGDSIKATLAANNFIDSYKFNGEHGEKIEISLKKSAKSTSALFRPCWELLDPSGDRIDSWEYDVTKTRILPINGLFTVRVWDHDQDGIGEYELSIKKLSTK